MLAHLKIIVTDHARDCGWIRNRTRHNSAGAESEENEDGMVTHRPRMLKNAAEVAKLDGRVDKMRAG